MYLPKTKNFEKLNKLYNKIDFNLEYDNRFIREEKRIKNIKYQKKTNVLEKTEEEEYIQEISYKLKKHLNNGGTEFGFKLYLIENNYIFKCKCCKIERHINDIELLFFEKEIKINFCKNCNVDKNKIYRNKFGDEKFIIKQQRTFYQKQRKRTDEIFKFKSNVRTLISSSFNRKKYNNWTKKYKSEEILGCSLDEFKKFIQNKFTENMSFNNYGKWHLDHIKPLALAKTEEEVILLNHYTNFQPLWAADNLQKSAKLL
jgi:hypothetical protein